MIAKEEEEEVCVDKTGSTKGMSEGRVTKKTKNTYNPMTQQIQDVKVGEKGLQPDNHTNYRFSGVHDSMDNC